MTMGLALADIPTLVKGLVGWSGKPWRRESQGRASKRLPGRSIVRTRPGDPGEHTAANGLVDGVGIAKQAISAYQAATRKLPVHESFLGC
ncbi:MAG: hypothetical protein ACRDZO_14055 [Egibacteraceae bacterium]